MPASWPLVFDSPLLFAIAGTVVIVSAVAAIVRRIAMPFSAVVLIGLGAVALVLAAGGLTWRAPRPGTIAVVVDVSASTRSADFHDPVKLNARRMELIGRKTYTFYRLADGLTRTDPGELRTEQSARRTVFDPPRGIADAIVLFTDGQFALPPPADAPPTYVVIDPRLDETNDSAVQRLEARDEGGKVAATVDVRRPPRQIVLTGTPARAPATLPVGHTVVTSPVKPDAHEVTAALRGGPDRWPENDSLTLRLPAPAQLQHWWVGPTNPGDGWRHMSSAQLPNDPADYLAPAVVVLEDQSVDDISTRQWQCIEQYVRDLGGGLVIVGGEHAFAAGHYTGSPAERISPLASTPPKPANHWILLADSSGSMAAALGDNSRWAFAINAFGQIVPLLPPDDLISTGSFAESLRWWRTGRPVRELRSRFYTPNDIRPSGPTNLAAALAQLAQSADPGVPSQLLLITDAQAKIANVDDLAGKLKAANVRVHLMCTDKLPADNPVRQLVERTGGTSASEVNPRRWAASLKTLLRGVAVPYLEKSPLQVSFTDAGPALTPVSATPWNRTWRKPSTTELATGRTGDGQTVPAAAAGFYGSGAAIAVAFHADIGVVAPLAERVAVPPRDPRFTITWDTAQPLRVRIDAADGSNPLNALPLQLQVFSGDPSSEATTRPSLAIPQTAPGRYELSIPAPTRAVFALLRLDGRTIDRIAVAGRYAPEFDAIGNNRDAMRDLARATGGGVIEPTQTTPIDFNWPLRSAPLAGYCAIAGAVLVAAGLIRWRTA